MGRMPFLPPKQQHQSTVGKSSTLQVPSKVVLVFCEAKRYEHFYRATYAVRCICYGPVSVSVTSQSSTKMAKHRNTQTTPRNTPGSVVF